jgi:hypothetical protein
MEGIDILKTAGKIILWLIGAVIVPMLAALGLQNTSDIEPKVVYYYFAAFYILCFFLSFIYYLILELIKKQVLNILIEKNIIKKNMRKLKK